jgi:lysophospholipase L1-like esterase
MRISGRWLKRAMGGGALLAVITGCGSASDAESSAAGATAVGGYAAVPIAGAAPTGAGLAGATSTGGTGGAGVANGAGAGNGDAGAANGAGAGNGGASTGNGGADSLAGASNGGASAAAGAGGAPPDVLAPCTTNQLSKCSGTPLACHFGGDPGNYEVTVELGGTNAGLTEVEAEYYRRMLTQSTSAGQTNRFSFVTNVRVYEGEPLRPDQDGTTSKGIPGLDVYFRGASPRPVSICFQAKPDSLMLWIEGDSTVTDQESTSFSGWGQHLPQHFRSPISVANYADSGESSGSVLNSAKLWPTIKKGMKRGDWVMVQLGHNDKNVAAATFKGNLTTMVHDVKAAGAQMVLVTPISRVGAALAAQHVNEVGANLPQIIRDLGKSENVPVIDLTVTTWNWLQTIQSKDYFVDSTHTNHRGADVVSGFVRDAVKAQLPELAKHLR